MALASLPKTSEALRRGELSGVQLKIIAGAAAENPKTETELLKAAAEQSLKGLKEEAAGVRAAVGSAEQEKARYAAIYASRYVRHWADPDGAFRLDAKLTPVDGAKLLSALKAEADVRFKAARKSEVHENPSAYSADALVALVTGEAAGPASKALRSIHRRRAQPWSSGSTPRRYGVGTSKRARCVRSPGWARSRWPRSDVSSPMPGSRSSCTTART